MWKRIVLAIILAVVVSKAFRYVVLMGFHKTVYNHTPGPCRLVEGIEHGSEDIQLLPGGKALVTSGLRFMEEKNPHYADYVGNVFLIDMNRPDQPAEPVQITGDVDPDSFNPHGLSAWVSSDTGLITIFIINHIGGDSVVEKFNFSPETNTLIHLETIGSGFPTFRILNDLIAVSDTEFYFTNYAHYGIFELYLQVYWGTVGFYDGREGRYAVSGLLLPNGISVSPDGKYIYVVNIGEEQVRTYERASDNSLTFISATDSLNTAPDNINVDPDTGDLWLGCHPIGWKIMRYLHNPSVQSPSQVLRMRVEDGRVVDVTEPFVNDGTLISGSASALYYKGKLAVGSVAGRAVICDAKYW